MADETESDKPRSKDAGGERGTLAGLAELHIGPVSLNLRILLEPIGFLRILLLVSWVWHVAAGVAN